MDATAFPTNINFIVAATASQRHAAAGPMDACDTRPCHVVLAVEVAQ